MARSENNIVVPIELPQPHAFRANPGYGPIRETNISAIGHSFIDRLDVKLEEDRKNTPLELQDQLKLRAHHIKPALLGMPGAYIEDMTEFGEDLEGNRTEALILEIGSNDICRSTPVIMLVHRIRNLCKALLKNVDTLRYIVVGQVLFRQKIDRRFSTKTVWQYNADVIEYNKELREWIDSTNLPVRYWSHRNLKFPEVAVYEDGVHPSTTEGLWRYQKSIRSAMIMADRFLPL